MAQTMSTMEQALKIYYIDAIRYQLNDKVSPWLARVERNSKDISGSKAKMALKYSVSGAVGARDEYGNLPIPSARKYQQAEWETKNIYGRIRISDKLMKASRNRKGAFVSQLDAQLEDLLTDTKLDVSRQSMGDGTGKLFTVGAAGANNSTTVPVDNVQYLMENMLIDFITKSSGNEVKTDCRIVAIDRDAKTILLDKKVTVASTEIGVIAGAYNKEMTGLAKVFDHTNFETIYGINRTNNKWFRTNTVNVNNEISEVKIQEGLDEVEIAAGEPVDFLISSYGVRRAYLYYMSSQKRIVNTIEIKGGFKAPEFNGIPLVADRFMPAKTMYGLTTKDWNLYEIGDWDWMAEDGAILSRTADKAAYEATLIKYADLGCSKLRGQVQFTNITEH